MPRSLRTSPVVVESPSPAHPSRKGEGRRPIKIWSRRSTVTPQMVGTTFAVHDGETFIRLFVTERMVGRALGDLVSGRSSTTRASKPSTAKPRVLVVDDDRSTRDAYSRWLAEAGFAAGKASSAASAMRSLRQRPVDLVLLDSSLPEMKGLQLLRDIRATRPKTAVVMVLDRYENSTATRARSLGAAQCLVKPIDETVLEEAVGGVLGTAREIPDQPAEEGDGRDGLGGPGGERLHFARLPELGSRAVPSLPGRAMYSCTATAAKNELGKLLDRLSYGAVCITRHETPKAVLLSIDDYEALAGTVGRNLDDLTREFDAMLERMQTPGSRDAMMAAFGASPSELGVAARAAAKRG